jgi:hypothetical protein
MAKKNPIRPTQKEIDAEGVLIPPPVNSVENIIEEIRVSAEYFWNGTRLEKQNWLDWLDGGATGKSPSTNNSGLLKLVEALEFRRSAKQNSAPPSDYVLTQVDLSILRELMKAGSTMQQVTLEAAISVTSRTIRDRLKVLRENGLTHRPHGNRGGEAITGNGIKRLTKIDGK